MEMEQWKGQPVIDRDGSKIGTIEDVYFDIDTHAAEWARVRTGLFGTRDTIIPITTAAPSDDGVRVPFEKSYVKDAPNVGDDEELSEQEEARLAEYYGLGYSNERSSSGLPSGQPTPTQSQKSPKQSGDNAMTRSEEELRVGKVRRPSELVRLKKHVVTEQKQVTVPVQREELRVEREPITDANRAQALAGEEIRENEYDLTLHEEQVKVEKEVVPKERVRLERDVSTTEQRVDAEVEKERIDIEREGR